MTKRVPQEKRWLGNRDSSRVEVYVGRPAGTRTPDHEVWYLQIRLAESFLIHARCPPMIGLSASPGGLSHPVRIGK